MKNKTPILVLTGLAIVAAFGIAGLTREQWMGQPTPAVATPEPAPAEKPAATAEAPATPEKPAATAEAPAAAEQPAGTAEAPAAAGQPAGTAEAPAAAERPAGTAETPAPAEQTTAAATPDKPAEPPPAAEQPAATQPATEQPAAEQPKTQPEQSASVQPDAPAVSETQLAQNAAPEAQVPTFDTVRVEKTGEALIAGRAAPGSEVVVKLDGQEIGKTVANDDGAFVLVPEKPLPSGSGAITIEATGKGDLKSVASNESVAVIVPEGQQQQALVAVVSPDAPTKVLQKPEALAEAPKATEEQPAAEQKPAKLVSIEAVDYDATGNIVFSGQGDKGNTARIYIDNNFLGDAPVGDDGRWSYSATADIPQGVHTLRVDGLDAKGSVLNRVEVPIFREDQTKVAAATPPATEQPKTEQPKTDQPSAAAEVTETPAPAEKAVAEQPAEPAQPAQTVTEAQKTEPSVTAEAPAAEQPAGQQNTTVAEQPAKTEEPAPAQTAETAAPASSQETSQQSQDTVAATAPDASAAAAPKEGRIVIQPGNNLWRISRVLYGNGNKFTMLYEANKDQIRNPNLIYPGQVFRTPEVAPKADTIDPQRREPLTPEENAGAAQ